MNQNVHTSEVLSPRAMVFIGIVGFHAVLVYFLSHGLMRITDTYLKPSGMEVVFPPEDPVKITPTEQSEQNPTLTPTPPVVVPEPIIDVVENSEPVFVATTAGEPPPDMPAQPVAPVEPPVRLVGHDVFPDVDSYYPARERRDEVQGTAIVNACVDEKGKLEGAPAIETSSGSPGLDNAAIRVAKAGRYARSMRGEQAVPNCHRFRVTFTLN